MTSRRAVIRGSRFKGIRPSLWVIRRLEAGKLRAGAPCKHDQTRSKQTKEHSFRACTLYETPVMSHVQVSTPALPRSYAIASWGAAYVRADDQHGLARELLAGSHYFWGEANCSSGWW